MRDGTTEALETLVKNTLLVAEDQVRFADSVADARRNTAAAMAVAERFDLDDAVVIAARRKASAIMDAEAKFKPEFIRQVPTFTF